MSESGAVTAPGEAQQRAAETRAVAHRAVTEGVDLRYVEKLRQAAYKAADEIEALVERVEAAERERDAWKRHAQTSDKEVAALRKAAGDPDYSPAYQNEYQRLWHEAAARVAELEEALRAVEHYSREFTAPNWWMAQTAIGDCARKALAGVPVAPKEQE